MGVWSHIAVELPFLTSSFLVFVSFTRYFTPASMGQISADFCPMGLCRASAMVGTPLHHDLIDVSPMHCDADFDDIFTADMPE